MKVRVRYSKLGKVRFVGNLDVLRIWERTLRKAGLPVAYSTGFSPRPRLSFGLALPMAAESLAEYVDVELATAVGIDDVALRLADALPAGFAVGAVAERQPGTVSLQEAVVACDWVIGIDGVDPAQTREAAARVQAASSLPLSRERKGERRVDDVRPSIEALHVDEAGALCARLATTGRGLRPGELVRVLFGDDGIASVRSVLRTEQWIECDGSRRELLPLPATVAVPAGAGA